jgi:transposase-like protein
MTENTKSRAGQSRKKEIAVLALLTEPTHAEAAKKAGISESTLYRWVRDDDEFKEMMRGAKREAMSKAIAKIQMACSGAVDVLIAIAHDKKAPAKARVEAAKELIGRGIETVKMEEIMERLERLEAATKDESSKPWQAH